MFAPADVVFESLWSWEFSTVLLREKVKGVKQKALSVEQWRKLRRRNMQTC